MNFDKHLNKSTRFMNGANGRFSLDDMLNRLTDLTWTLVLQVRLL